MTDDLDATTRLEHAITALTTTTPHVLHREDEQARHDTDQAHLEHIRYLRKRLTRARDDEDRDRIRCAMTEAGTRHRDRRAALRAELTATPSLLEQLIEAVHSTSGTGNGSRGVHRSPLNTAAVELLHDIRRSIGTDDTDPTTPLLTWAYTVTIDTDQAAAHAERWLDTARDILDPNRRIEAKAACPLCHTRHVWITEGHERIRRAAIQINLTTRTARCIAPGCTGHWDRDHIDLLARVLEQDINERTRALT